MRRDEIKELREELAKLRERVAVLESKSTPAPYYVPYFYEPYRWIGPQWSYTTGTLTATPADVATASSTFTTTPGWSA